MKIASILENTEIEKRISITPDIAKKYIDHGFEVALSENYGTHLGYNDQSYIDLGVKVFKNENEVIEGSDIIVQLGLLDDDKIFDKESLSFKSHNLIALLPTLSS